METTDPIRQALGRVSDTITDALRALRDKITNGSNRQAVIDEIDRMTQRITSMRDAIMRPGDVPINDMLTMPTMQRDVPGGTADATLPT